MPYLLGLIMTFLFIFLKHLLQILNCSYQIQQSFTFFYLISKKVYSFSLRIMSARICHDTSARDTMLAIFTEEMLCYFANY